MDFDWSEKNVLVAGATEFLGSWLVKGLLDKKANVVILIRDGKQLSESALSGSINKIDIVHGSLENFFVVERCINEYEVNIIFYISAQTAVDASIKSPLATFESNIRGTWNLLEACRQNKKVEGVITASSNEAYNVTNICSDILSRSYFKTYKLNVAAARCSDIYGGGDLNFERIVPGIISSILKNKNPAIKSNGAYVRDYLYITDAVDACLKLAEKSDMPEVKGEFFNFCSNNPISVLDLVKMILEISGKTNLNPIIKNTVKREISGEINEKSADSSKSREILKWSPKFSLKEGLIETFKWYESHER